MATQDRNPSPPTADLLNIDPELLHADTIGDTVFSKRWVFSTLMKLLKEVEKEPAGKSSQELDAAKAHGIDIDESLEADLCKLWDMTANQDVAKFLHEWKSLDILTSVIEQTTAPRVTEICMGILANMACSKDIAGHISSNQKIRSLTLDFLGSSDTQTLIQTTRLLLTCLSSKIEETVGLWLQQITEEFCSKLAFILQSSTNIELLYNVGFIMSTLFSLDETLVQDWTDTEQIVSVIEALRQVRSGEKSRSGQSRTISLLLSCLEIIVADDDGMTNLVSASDTVLPLLADFLWSFCEDEVVTVDGSEGSLASTIYIVEVVIANMEGANDIVETLSKYPKLLKGAVEIFASLYSQKAAVEQNPSADQSKDSSSQNTSESNIKQKDTKPSSSSTEEHCLNENKTGTVAKATDDVDHEKGQGDASQGQTSHSKTEKLTEPKTLSDSSSGHSSNSHNAPVGTDRIIRDGSTAVSNPSDDHSDDADDESHDIERKELSDNLSSFFVFLLREAGGSTSQSQVASLLRDACSHRHRSLLREGMAKTKANPEIQQLLAATLGDDT
ncbi:protein SAAL1-like [Patiria miniata]|uniref:Uncharacterized protein n=1 Tax=Patiria miniata TaxID=46514 RepID=A0A913ZSN2_PATMI|nr:protein SAAL1-like [Patiria miniata]